MLEEKQIVSFYEMILINKIFQKSLVIEGFAFGLHKNRKICLSCQYSTDFQDMTEHVAEIELA